MRYYLHQLQTSRIVRDLEGSEHPDLQSAHGEAIEAAREMMATAVRRGRDISDWSISVADAEGNTLVEVPFASVVSRDTRPIGG